MPRVFQGSLKHVPRKFFRMLQGRFKGVSRKIEWCFKEISVGFKGV